MSSTTSTTSTARTIVVVCIMCLVAWVVYLGIKGKDEEARRIAQEKEQALINDTQELFGDLIDAELDQNFKIHFTQAYKQTWDRNAMNSKLSNSVETIFNKEVEDLMWGTRTYQLSHNSDGILDKIQTSVVKDFAPSFESFMKDVSKNWEKTLRDDIKNFYQNTVSKAIQLHSLSTKYTPSKAMLTGLKAQLPNMKFDGMTTALEGAALSLAAKAIGMSLVKGAAGGALSGVLGSTLSTVVPFLGAGLAAWGAFDFISSTSDTYDEIYNSFQSFNRNFYYNELPAQYWKTIASELQSKLFGGCLDFMRQVSVNH